ncbi:MAG: DUF5058 family protein [Candidatus Aminicenantes bacterium]|nr:DUF5058 family protein [Candidatus Aminicenantes bacterium]
MKEYLEIANSGYFYLWGAVILLVIFIQAVLFIRLAWKRGKTIGLTGKRMLQGLRAGMVSAVIPSIPIVISLIAMSGVLGVPFPWIRLSVIGSAPYELLSAGIGAESMGVEGLGSANYTQFVFANSVWVMTIGAMWSGLMVFFFLKMIKKQYAKIENRDPDWMKIISAAAFFGVVCIFLARPITAGGLPLITVVTGAVLMTICALLIEKLKIKWLREFALPISMVGAMAGAVIFGQLLS